MKRPYTLGKCLLILALLSLGYSQEVVSSEARCKKQKVKEVMEWFKSLPREEAIDNCDNDSVERLVRIQCGMLEQLINSGNTDEGEASPGALANALKVKGDDILREYRLPDFRYSKGQREKENEGDSNIRKARCLHKGIAGIESAGLCQPHDMLEDQYQFDARVTIEKQKGIDGSRAKITIEQLQNDDLISFINEVSTANPKLRPITQIRGILEEAVNLGKQWVNIIADVAEEATGLKYSLAATNVEGIGLSQYYPLFIFQKALENVGTDSPVIPLNSVALNDTDSVLISNEWETLPLAVATAAGIRRSSRAVKTLVNVFSKLPEMRNLGVQFQEVDGQIAEVTEQLSLYISSNS
jgi:hypothetical protein